MEPETGMEQTVIPEPVISLPFPKAAGMRVIYALYLIVMPALAFWGIGALQPEWQSGEFSTYLALFLSPEASLVFLFLLVYAVICYLFLLYSPTLFSEFFFIRLGIYTGTLLALQYSILTLIYSLDQFIYVIIPVWILPLIVPAIYRWAVDKWKTSAVNTISFILLSGILLAGIVVARAALLLFILMALVMAAPFWAFLIALRAARWLFENHETDFTLPLGPGPTAWLAAYIAAWSFDIVKVYELYAALPKSPSNCYIATAAARGHPQFVHSWTVHCADGNSMQVNRQLQRLKCAELALMAVHPRLHKLLRQIYDVVGKYLAGKMQNPFLADAAYLLLKPWEWCAGFVLKFIIPEMHSISKKMYMN